jgi:hypothetical protein
MDLVDGADLRGCLSPYGTLAPAVAVQVMIALLGALDVPNAVPEA